jgi:hypothetical protein
MPAIDLVVESKIAQSGRVRQLSAMFDCPADDVSRREWHGDIPIDGDDWNVGLIVGPSGAGKSSIARQLFGDRYEVPLEWTDRAVIDDFAADRGMEDITGVCQAVGFNTIPAWMRPFAVLSNGEKFRVELARRLLELGDPIVVDEFTSVVDRQVAQIGSHAVQKYVRRHKRKFVAVSCHYDIVDWLQPDWIFEPHTMHFARRGLQQRPTLDIAISRVPYSAWELFAPFHYMSAELHKSARCFGLFVGGRIASFAGVLHRPISRSKTATAIWGISRLVTLPDWQGVGLAMMLCDKLGSMYAAMNCRTNMYPSHPSLVRSFAKSSAWRQLKLAGSFTPISGLTPGSLSGWGGRPNATFEYCGAIADRGTSQSVLGMAI